MRTIIDAHPDIFIPTESLFIVDYLLYEKYIPKTLMSWFFFNEPQLRVWYSGPQFRIKSVRDAVIRVHNDSADKKRAKIWGQKTPRFVRYMELFNVHFKGIHWILIYRDPRAVVASMLKSKRHTYAIHRACRRWNRDNRVIIDLLNDSEKRNNILIIKYEDLINNFDKLLREMFKFLSVAPISRDEVVSQGTTPRLKGSKFEIITVRDGLAPQRKIVDNWKKSLTQKQIQKIESFCAKGMERLGYSPISHLIDEDLICSKEEEFMFFKDFLILLEYLHKWPSYLFHTAIRKGVFKACYWIHKLCGKA